MIPVNEPLLGLEEQELVLESVRSGWISSAGIFVDRFESEWAEICDRRFGVAVSNGTVALQLAVAAADLPPGSEIIMPTFTIVSCALAAIYNDCRPVFVDSDPSTWCMDVSKVAEAITSRTTALMPVHIYGHPVDMDPLLELADRHRLVVIEDAAEAHGAQYRSARSGIPTWRPCGGLGDVSTFSFYANKLVTTGEGGMLLMDREDLAQKARSLRNLGFSAERRFLHQEPAFNFRFTNLQAAVGVAQLKRFPNAVRKKREIAAEYMRFLADVPGLILPAEEPWARSIYWMFGIVIDERVPFDALELGKRLRARGVETRPFFLGLHEQPFLESFVNGSTQFPVAERLARRGLYLPTGLTLDMATVGMVASHLREALRD